MALINCPECNKQISDKATICVGCGAPVVPPKQPQKEKPFPVGVTKKLGILEIAQFDFREMMSWDDAKKACQSLGNGWRLPTKEELNTLYRNRSMIGNFGTYYYWSATEKSNSDVWFQSFTDGAMTGRQLSYPKKGPMRFRAVRDNIDI